MIYLRMIISGGKTLEARANYSHFRDWKSNQTLIFRCNETLCRTKIIALRNYPTVQAMLDCEDIDRLLPGYDRDNAERTYNGIYPPHKIRANNGMIVVEVIKQ